MTRQKVPLVVYEDGVRRIVGEAVVDSDGGLYLAVMATITDDEYRRLLQGSLTELSLGSSEELDVKPEKKTRWWGLPFSNPDRAQQEGDS